MPNVPASLTYYDNAENAGRYHSQTGFDPARKQEMLHVTLHLLMDLVPAGGSLLELGCGSGLFTAMLSASGHFGAIRATDGAEAMLAIARPETTNTSTLIAFESLDFAQPNWANRCQTAPFDAVTSSMALHHAEDRQQLFRQVYEVLNPGGAFVFADHMAGSSSRVDRLIGRERGRVKMGAEATQEDLESFVEADGRSQKKQGNHCQSVTDYLGYLGAAGFVGVDCLWRSYWLAVFVAQKP